MIMRGPQVSTIPPRQGRRNLLAVLNQILAAPRIDGAGSADLGAGLRERSARWRRDAGLIAVVSDFQSDPATWSTELGATALRHSVLCVQVVDPRDLELPPVGRPAVRRPGDGSDPRGEHR